MHGVGVPENLSLYQMVEKNTATGREEKNKFDELEVQSYWQQKLCVQVLTLLLLMAWPRE